MPVRKIELELEALSRLRTCESPEALARDLRKALSAKVNVIVAKAAAISAERQVKTVIPDLCAAFERLLINPLVTDPQCWGKEAIAKALKVLAYEESAIFLKGAQHVQLEPVWGGDEDTATGVRAACTLALLGCTDQSREDKLWAVMRLLTEKSPSLRRDASLALESLAGRESALLLRLKARMGDNDSTVAGQVFESLLRVEGEAAVPFVVEFLRDPSPEAREEAALALGASRLAAAVEALQDALSQKHLLLSREVLLRALGISRHEKAIVFLLEIVRSRRLQEALEALEVLKLFRDSTEIRSRVAEAVASRSEVEIQQFL